MPEQCRKTGMTVHLSSHGVTFPADMYRVGNTAIFRLTVCGADYDTLPHHADVEVTDVGVAPDIWDRRDLGVIVVNSDLVKFHNLDVASAYWG